MRIAMVSEHASPLVCLAETADPARSSTDQATAAGIGAVDAGGQNVHVHALATALGRAGHEVVVHTRRTDPTTPQRVPLAPNVVVDHVPAGPAVELGKDDLLEHMGEFAAVLRRRWTARPPDIAHAHFWMSGLAALDAGRATGVPVTQTFHALGSVKRRHQGTRDTSPAERVARESDLAASVDRVIATCHDEVAELVELGVSADRIDVVPCGVDVEHFTPSPPAASHDVPRILTVSRLVPRKGIDTVIRALGRLARRAGPVPDLVVAGGPTAATLDDDAEVARLRAIAASEGVADRVHFVGRVAPAEMPALMRSADVVACLPAYEPFGLVPLEAMACARPVVAARVGGLADTVVDGHTGLHVPPGDADAAARAIGALLADPARAARLGGAGRARAQARYGWDRIAAATEAVYRDVLAAHPEPVTSGTAAGLTGVRS
jgi:glycosyltransferase involved in cell wall biosynthesis